MYRFKNKIVLIRHAATVENQKKLCLGWIKTHTKKKELKKTTHSLIDELSLANIDCILTSELNRTIVTAEYLNQYLLVNEMYSNSLFNDLNFGIYSKKKPALIKKKQPEIYDKGGLFKYDVCLFGGESLQDMEKRVNKGISLLENMAKYRKILLVTHGSFIMMMYKVFYNTKYNEVYLRLHQNLENKLFKFE
ncbi:hypothetical protein GF358_00355 [Candidatus Woesearchaeota archaeon]|nr:hypothetical protein [Candidatus Woesearchaeota archaeon]